MNRIEQPERFGDRLARLRRTTGLSQKDLAVRINTQSKQISKWERGTYEPRFSVVVKLAAVLGTSTDYLLTGKEELVEADRLADLCPALELLPLGLRNEIADFLKTLVRAGCLVGLGGAPRAASVALSATGKRNDAPVSPPVCPCSWPSAAMSLPHRRVISTLSYSVRHASLSSFSLIQQAIDVSDACCV